jgi:hypothetical protein
MRLPRHFVPRNDGAGGWDSHIALLLRMSPPRVLSSPAVHFTSLSGATKRFGCLS